MCAAFAGSGGAILICYTLRLKYSVLSKTLNIIDLFISKSNMAALSREFAVKTAGSVKTRLDFKNAFVWCLRLLKPPPFTTPTLTISELNLITEHKRAATV